MRHMVHKYQERYLVDKYGSMPSRRGSGSFVLAHTMYCSSTFFLGSSTVSDFVANATRPSSGYVIVLRRTVLYDIIQFSTSQIIIFSCFFSLRRGGKQVVSRLEWRIMSKVLLIQQ